MLRYLSSNVCWRAAFGCAWVLLPFACAHGVETSLEPTLQGDTAGTGTAGIPVTIGTGGVPTGGGGATGGNAGTTMIGAGGSAGTTSAGGSAGTTGASGAGGSTAGASGAAGRAGNGGAGGASGSGGSAGSAGTGGASGNGGTGGSGGKAGNGGSAGSAGSAGTGGAGGGVQPTSITLPAMSTPSGQRLTLTSTGMTFTQRCASQNDVIIGYTGTVDPPNPTTNWLRSFQAVCASLSITGTGPYTVHTTQTAVLTAHGAPQSVAIMQMCPANQIVVGFGSRTGGAIDQFTFVCSPLAIGGTSPNFTLTLGPQTTLQPLGGPGGSPQANIFCPAGMVSVGDEGREGTAIEAFGLLCGTPTLVVR